MSDRSSLLRWRLLAAGVMVAAALAILAARLVYIQIIHHDDYLVPLQGSVMVGLRDLRHGSPTEGTSVVIPLSGNELTAIRIPAGIAHGFYLTEPSVVIYSVTEYWNPDEEMGCHWSDPALEFTWKIESEPIVSLRDADLPSLDRLIEQLEPYQALLSEP